MQFLGDTRLVWTSTLMMYLKMFDLCALTSRLPCQVTCRTAQIQRFLGIFLLLTNPSTQTTKELDTAWMGGSTVTASKKGDCGTC